MVFEDAPSGVQAANAASMQVIAVPDPNMSHDSFKDATAVIDSLNEFDIEDWLRSKT